MGAARTAKVTPGKETGQKLRDEQSLSQPVWIPVRSRQVKGVNVILIFHGCFRYNGDKNKAAK